MKIYVFDIDGTICTNTYGDYGKAVPFYEKIKLINNLYDSGKYIKFFTARGSGTGKDWYLFTKNQLDKWGVKYHELIMGKPEGDIYVDDKGRNALSWIWPEVRETFTDKEKFLETIKDDLIKSSDSLNAILKDHDLINRIGVIAESILETLSAGGKIIFAGNGGSFADSQHLSAEFVAKFSVNRSALPALALGTNSSTSTAISNDYGFDEIFARELEAIANKDDIFIGFSTSGNSKNIVNVIEKCKKLSIKFYVFTGISGGECKKYNENVIRFPSDNVAIIQQLHITVGHILCHLVDKELLDNE